MARVLNKSKCNFTLPMMYKSIISEYCVQARRETYFLKRGGGISTNGTDVIGKSSQKNTKVERPGSVPIGALLKVFSSTTCMRLSTLSARGAGCDIQSLCVLIQLPTHNLMILYQLI